MADAAPGRQHHNVSHLMSPWGQTVSQKSLTGFRLAFTEVSRSGTVLVRSATAVTPPVTWRKVAWMALKWKMTRSNPTAVIAIISAATIRVNQAAAGMAVAPSRSAEQFRDGSGVPDRAHGDRVHGRV